MTGYYEKQKHDAYRASQAVEATFFYECQRAGIDHRNVPKALAELAEREAMKSMLETPTLANWPTKAHERAMLESYIAMKAQLDEDVTKAEQAVTLRALDAMWTALSRIRNARLQAI